MDISRDKNQQKTTNKPNVTQTRGTAQVTRSSQPVGYKQHQPIWHKNMISDQEDDVDALRQALDIKLVRDNSLVSAVSSDADHQGEPPSLVILEECAPDEDWFSDSTTTQSTRQSDDYDRASQETLSDGMDAEAESIKYSKIQMSRFTKVHYTYTQAEYDRTSVEMSHMTEQDWDEWERDRKRMREDYYTWQQLHEL